VTEVTVGTVSLSVVRVFVWHHLLR
jgi:hypothetical protein